MRKRLCLLGLCCLLLTGCVRAGEPYEEHDALAAMAGCPSMTVCYPDGDGGALPVTRVLPWETDMAAAVLHTLSDPPEGLDPAVPEGVTFQVALEGDAAVVNIQSLPPFADAAAESSAIACVVDTVLALPEVNHVSLHFDGESLVSLKHGTEVHGVFTGESAPRSTPE